MKTVRSLCAAVCAALALFALIVIPLTGMRESPAAKAPAQQTAAYTVREYEGRIAVFEGDAAAPSRVLPTEVTQLPEEDRQLLGQGLCASTQAELQRILEDYSE